MVKIHEVQKPMPVRALGHVMNAILYYRDECFDLTLLCAPLKEKLGGVSGSISVAPPDTPIKPVSILSNQGNGRVNW